ncbi:MAG TPA: hypothetical protein VGJ75_10690 [Dongiaceae bacterium]|jgi:hypothetical protein
MGDVIKALLAAPANAVLLVAGLAFLAVAIFRRITDRLDAGPKGRLFAAVLGIALVGLSLYLSTGERSVDTTSTATTASVPTQAANATQSTASYPMALPAGQVVKGDERTYTILKVELDKHEIDQLALTFTVRMVNEGKYPANFWNADFRLLADGVPLAPFNMLDEVVDANAAKEGTVSFAFPANTKQVALQIDKFGADAPGLPINLPGQP